MRDRGWTPVGVGSTPPKGAYSRGARAGDLLFVSGQVPRSFESGELLGSSIEDQTRSVLANLQRVLAAEGLSLADVVSVTAYLADIGEWDAFDAIYRSVFQAPYPARTTLGASLHGVLVEISAVAAYPR
jgi:2-iminobutanoate/2-iminopropanoate deaminase